MRQVHRMTNHFLNHLLPLLIIRTKTISSDKTYSSRHTAKTSNTIHLLMLKLISLVAQTVKRLRATQETLVQSLGQEDPLEKETVTHSSTLAWKIPWTEKPGRLQSMASQRVGTGLSDFTFNAEITFTLPLSPISPLFQLRSKTVVITRANTHTTC